MKKKNLLIMSLSVLMSLSFVACGGNPVTDSTSENPSENPTSNTTNGGDTTTSNNGNTNTESYGVVVVPTTGATVTASVNVAHPGDVVTLSVKIDDGYILDEITLNGTKLTANEFVMPSTSALIQYKVSLLSTDGMYIGGDVSSKLVLNEKTGVYEAKGVKVAIDSNVFYSINGKKLSCIAINNEKCFANIDITSTSNAPGFSIAGGATYDFYYDPVNSVTPCYVVRTSVDALPTNIKSLESLFSGSIKSETTVYPQGVNHVEFTSSEYNENYVWDLYSDNASVAKITTLTNGKDKGLVYKSIDNSIYTVVDTYLEGEHTQDLSVKGDTVRYSGHYDVVATPSAITGMKKYQRTQDVAYRDVNAYSHTIESLQYEIMFGYSWGHENVVSDDVYDWNVKIESTDNADGTFTTNVNSYTSIVAGGTEYSSSSNQHNEYQMKIKFKNDGSLIELTYDEQNYNDNQFDFSGIKLGTGHGSFKPGGKDYPASEHTVTCKYGYGSPKEGKPTGIDLSKYFVSEITSASVTSSAGVEGQLKRLDRLTQVSPDIQSELSSNVKLEFAPESALDTWQYGVVASSNESVVTRKAQHNDLWTAVGSGTTTITFGNHTSQSVNKSIEITVPESSGDYKDIFAYTVYPYINENWTSTSGVIPAGTRDSIKLAGVLTSNAYDYFPICTPESSSELLLVSYDQTTGMLTLDATPAKGITEATTVTITLKADYNLDWTAGKEGGSKLTVTIKPTTKLYDSVVGTWTTVLNDGETAESIGYDAKITFTDETITHSGKNYKRGNISVTIKNESGKTNVYTTEFGYQFDKETQTFTSQVFIAGTYNGKAVYTGSVKFAIDNEDGYLLAFATVVPNAPSAGDDGEWTSQEIIYIGDYDEGDGETDPLYYYYDFELAQ